MAGALRAIATDASLSSQGRRIAGGIHQADPSRSGGAGLSRDLIDSMNDIVWAINPNRDHLSDLAQRMRRFASDVFTARDIEFSFAGPRLAAQYQARSRYASRGLPDLQGERQ